MKKITQKTPKCNAARIGFAALRMGMVAKRGRPISVNDKTYRVSHD